ncbi:MAG: MCE family protein [Actinobacteria bacterium]|nr:MCE family protein [Actinomycetota bacterium]
MDPTLVRRILGTTSVILLLGLSFLGLKARYAPPAGSYEVKAVLGTAGVGLSNGNDVKIRGVHVGSVGKVEYIDGRAVATLVMDPEPPLPAPDLMELRVTAKTLLGEKQIELFPVEDDVTQGPRLEAGDVIVAGREPTELSEVLDEMTPFIEAIGGQDFATIVEALGEQQGEAEVIIENLELGAELAAFGERTAEENLANFGRFADVADALTPVADDITRLNRALPEATRVLREEQARLTTNLEVLSRFAVGFAEYLEVEESALSRLMRTGDVVGAMLERQQHNIGELVHGLTLYFEKFPHGIDLNDGTEAGAFKIFLDFHFPGGEGEEAGASFGSEITGGER